MYNHPMLQDGCVYKIGMIARKLIDQGTAVVVLGVTSRGIFLRLEHGDVIFLSKEEFAGPLVLNIQNRLGGLSVGDRLQIKGRVFFHERDGFCVDTIQAEVWQPVERPARSLSDQVRRQLLQQVVREFSVYQFPEKSRHLELLSALNDAPDMETGPGSELLHAFSELRENWAGSRGCLALPLALKNSLIALLGLGSGLTPSGDDVLVGLLLALNRWGDILAPGFPIQELNELVLAAAPPATTALSLSMLQCAAQGQADERLIEALDGLVTGGLAPMGIVERLRTYGASSGLDTLAGFSIACG